MAPADYTQLDLTPKEAVCTMNVQRDFPPIFLKTFLKGS